MKLLTYYLALSFQMYCMRYSFLLFFGLLIFFACSESKETRIQRFLAQGNDMVKKQNYEEAVNFYEGALQLDSCFVDAWNNLGTLYFEKKDYARAVQHYSRAVKCNPDYLQAYINRVNVYYESNELFSALKDLERIEQIKPDTMVVYFLRGLVLTKMRKYDEAKKNFDEALLFDGNNQDLVINLASIHYYQRNYDSARLLLSKITENPLADPNAWNTLALIEAESGNHDQALENINIALKRSPRNPFYLNNRGYIYLLKWELNKAIADINESITIDPYNAWAYRNKGIYYTFASSYDEAIAMFERAIKADPYVGSINFYLGEAYWEKGDRKAACSFYAKSLAADEGEKVPVIRERCSGI